MEPVQSLAKIILVFGLFLGASAWIGQTGAPETSLQVTTLDMPSW
ncbi:hypothetical protein QQM79_04140 [Marinobacteraceae bacterium S3BR75-40.1]